MLTITKFIKLDKKDGCYSHLFYFCLRKNRLTPRGRFGDTKAVYRYTADGVKLGVKGKANDGFEYRGSLVYKRDNGVLSLESAAFPEGRIYASGAGKYVPRYFVTDHLGSVRVEVEPASNGGIDATAVHSYYPFGLRQSTGSLNPQSRYLYNGKEKQTTGNLDFLDYGARNYNPLLGRFFNVDPLAGNRPEESFYAFCGNNPINRIDPDGRDWYEDESGNAMWRRSQDKVFTDDNGVKWKNIGTTYLHTNGKGGGTYFYQKTNKSGEITLASHEISRNEMAVFNSFHSEDAKMAAIEDHVDSSVGSFLRMIGKELLAQWTTPELLVAGATIGVMSISSMGPKTNFGQNPNQVHHVFRHIDELGMSRSAVQSAVISDLNKISNIQVGQTVNRVITVNGQQLQYTVFKLNNGELNIGRIHAK